MDHIVLVLIVAVVGSLLLPATRIARVVNRRANRAMGGGTIGEIKEKTDYNPLSPSGAFEFRPLTAEEKKEFVNSLDAKGKHLLAELASEATSTSNPELLNTTSPNTAP